MKKKISIFAGAAVLALFVACLHYPNTVKPVAADDISKGSENVSEIETSKEEYMSDNTDTSEEAEKPVDSGNTDLFADGLKKIGEEENDNSKVGSTEGIDVDLTAISGILVYSEVYNMMGSPEKYIGKSVKMRGIYTIYFDETSEKRYDACIVQDATACCATGIEFVLTDDYVYPDDYPSEGEEITVQGVFDTYDEGNLTYCTLRNACLCE